MSKKSMTAKRRRQNAPDNILSIADNPRYRHKTDDLPFADLNDVFGVSGQRILLAKTNKKPTTWILIHLDKKPKKGDLICHESGEVEKYKGGQSYGVAVFEITSLSDVQVKDSWEG